MKNEEIRQDFMFNVYEEFGQCRVATKPVSIFSTITDVMMPCLHNNDFWTITPLLHSDKRDNFLKNAFVDFVSLCDLDVFLENYFQNVCVKSSLWKVWFVAYWTLHFMHLVHLRIENFENFFFI